MTDEPYADPALRAAFGSLLLDEPPAPPLVDDVLRGRARQRRRRARIGASTALTAVVVAAVAVAGIPRSSITGAPATAVPAPSAEQALDVAKLRIEPYLLTLGWTIVADNRPTLPEGSDRAEMDLMVVRSESAQDDDPQLTDIRVVTYPSAPQRGYYLSGCTPKTCTSVPTVADDCAAVLDCSTTQGALPKASVWPLEWGSLILDRTFRYDGSGQMVEVVIGADPATPTVATLGPVPFLDLAGARDLLDSLGNPLSPPTPEPSSTSEVPVVPGVSRQWLEGISPALGAQVGWVVDWPDSTVYGDVARGLQLDLTIVPGTQVQRDPLRFAVPSPPYPERASLRIWFAPNGQAPGAALAECPPDRCTRDLPDRKFPTYLDQAATAGTGTSLAPGTLVVDRTYDSGRFVELVSVPVESGSASPSGQAPRSVLSYGLAGAFLDALGAPEAAPAGGAASP